MEQTINIVNASVFENFVSSILKLVPSCKFEINKEECTVMCVDENGISRAFLKTNSVFSDQPTCFCLNEVQKFAKCIATASEYQKDGALKLIFDDTFIKLSSGIKFRLKTVKEDVIEKYISKPLKSELTPIFGCTLPSVSIKKLCSVSMISSSETPKVYLSKINDNIFGEIDDKKLVIADSIGIPLTKDIFGSWTSTITLKLDTFRLLNLIDCDKIKIALTEQKVLQVENEKTINSFFIKAKMITAVFKS